MTAEDAAAVAAVAAERERLRRLLLEMAARQDEFADPMLYHHLSDADRQAFRHAAAMLREAARQAGLLKGEGVVNGQA